MQEISCLQLYVNFGLPCWTYIKEIFEVFPLQATETTVDLLKT